MTVWTVTLPDGLLFRSDDLTLDDVIAIERESGEPWSLFNPFRSAKAAGAFLSQAMKARGLDESHHPQIRTLGYLKGCFGKTEDDDEPAGEDEEEGDGGEPVPLARTGRGSSSGAPAATGGRRKKHAASG